MSRIKRSLYAVSVPFVLLVAWEFSSRIGLVSANLLPPPSDILAYLVSSASKGDLWKHLWVTLARVFVGFGLGIAVALPAGVFVGLSKRGALLFDPLIQAFRAIPSLAWVPLFLIWLGIGESSKVALIAVGVFFPVYLNLLGGIQNVDRKLVEVGRMFGFSRLSLVGRIVFPAALPSFITGLRGGLGLGWMFVVAAELLGASQGLGFLLDFGRNVSRPEIVLASILLFAILGKLSDGLLKFAETRLLSWRDTLGGA